MLTLLRSTTLTAAVAAAAIFNAPREATAAFNVDCAMLLCLAGGWPKSAECTLAYATFIRRVTPWPIEPPLQIWRCPMGASYEGEPHRPMQRLYEAAFPDAQFPMQSIPTGSQEAAVAPIPAIFRDPEYRPDAASILQLVAGQGTDVDISDPIYDFVRSIRVFDVYARQREMGKDRDCARSSKVRIGSYGSQGVYQWRNASLSDLPAAHFGTEGYGSSCPSVYDRSIFVEWKDYSGNYGHEQVNY
ncbi:hypothetical protein ACOI1H_15020 [Loktanella sp. DJP18]|uniref:hypothetical protein n=1 Tax=Loktanella sp. DJP18 TaxID=3409788 RepID=UPI003BB74285